MVNGQATLDGTYAALADPTRRQMLARLVQGEATVGELAHPFAMSLPAISKHVFVLERAGLLSRRREGRYQICRLEPDALTLAADWLERHRTFWAAQLNALADHLAHPPAEEDDP
jgi:DNA-binding transcriptional ArsR family regulator